MTTTETKSRPIIFSGPMVRAILAGRKRQTRRVVKPQPWTVQGELDSSPGMWLFNHKCMEPCRYGRSGDELWVKENLRLADTGGIVYDADGVEVPDWELHAKGAVRAKQSSMFMPRWASRITLRITDVRVERLNKITKADAEAEGAEWGEANGYDARVVTKDVRGDFRWRWDLINGKSHPWSSNPWVWAISFERMGGES